MRRPADDVTFRRGPRIRAAAATIGLVALAACTAERAPQDATAGLRVRVPDGPTAPQLTEIVLGFPRTGPGTGSARVVPAFPQLPWRNDELTAITNAGDSTGRLFVCERAGRILVLPNDPNATQAGVFLDMRHLVQTPIEQGLLGLAFDPDYRQNGLFYVRYSGATAREAVFSEWRVSAADPNRADPSSERVLLRIPHVWENHLAGALAFGPDRMLYLAMGDGGVPGNTSPQDKTSLLGKILRIDPRARQGSLQYGIPPDNPFVGQGGGVREEIWALGFRNPWRFTFDRQSGQLWLGDVGAGWEEIDIVERGKNYGWPVFEGNQHQNQNPNGLPSTGFEPPAHEYQFWTGNRAVAGGYLYRGLAMPFLRGSYVFADIYSGEYSALTHTGSRWLAQQIALGTGPVSFGEDEAGELVMVHLNGAISRLVPSTGGGAPFPEKLSQTGIFTDVANLVVQPGIVEYDVNAPLWSDNAHKRRFVAAAGGALGFATDDHWSFPRDTVLVKHFELEMVFGDPTSRRRLETRVLVHEADGWAGYTYRWNAAQTDADLLLGSATEQFTIRNLSGQQWQQTWYYPSRVDCLRCHTPAAGGILGVRTAQLNRRGPAGTNQIDAWRRLGLARGVIGTSWPALPDPYDRTAPLAARARSYLDANCAGCHRPGGPGTGMDMRFTTPDGLMNLIGVPPAYGTLGLVNAQRIHKGVKESSVLWERMRRKDEHRMPPLATSLVDEVAVQVVGDWIDRLR
jgi:uncharacterized repeat protein (TIGR03806 family)